ncbi:MAG: hydroxymethylglutaryl-CoA lyase [Legionellaceae bacterium]|nr:hydroxymethylglutaryl-CoA lyase [Legionellaceae bacterium]
MKKPDIWITEVGPRDGLQNESHPISSAEKIAFIDALSQTGLSSIEVSSFVSSKSIPQLADASEVFSHIHKKPGVQYWALAANQAFLEQALRVGVTHIALFTAASESFTQKNIHCSIAESFERFKPMMETARAHHLTVRGYISCALVCPYEGVIDPHTVAQISDQLLALGVDEVSLGDTIGKGTPSSTQHLLRELKPILPAAKTAMHFHDTYGMSLVNILTALDFDIRRFDASVAGLGGCPYAKGASGNVSTEEVIYLLESLGLHTNIDLLPLCEIGQNLCDLLKKPNNSRVAKALLGSK